MSKPNKYDEVAGTVAPAEQVRTAYRQNTHANAWVPFVQAMFKALPIPGVVLPLAAAALITLDATGYAWLWTVAVLVAVFVGLTGYHYPERQRIADETLHNLERATQVDVNEDGYIPRAHPGRINSMTSDTRNTEARVIQREQANFRAFVMQAAKNSTVRGMKAAGWKDEVLNEIYRSWLLDIVRMPDGAPAAVVQQNGTWGLAYPLDDVLQAIDSLVWVVQAERATPAR